LVNAFKIDKLKTKFTLVIVTNMVHFILQKQ